MKEYRVKISVRNNLILSAIEEQGFKSASEFCRATGMAVTCLSSLVAMRKPPINRDGEFCAEAKLLMEILGAAPSDLWTDEQLTMCLKRNTAEKSVNFDAVQFMLDQHISTMTLPSPEDVYAEKEARELIGGIVGRLTDREQKVLACRLAKDETLSEVGKQIGVSRDRVRQIEQKAMRRLRHPKNSEELREIGADNGMVAA